MASAKRKPDARKGNKPGPKATDWRPGFMAALAMHPFDTAGAAARAGVARSTAWEERDKSPDFRAAWESIVEGAIDAREQTLLDCTASGAPKHENMTGLIFLLKARRKGIYGGVGDGPERPPAVVIFKDGRNSA